MMTKIKLTKDQITLITGIGDIIQTTDDVVYYKLPFWFSRKINTDDDFDILMENDLPNNLKQDYIKRKSL